RLSRPRKLPGDLRRYTSDSGHSLAPIAHRFGFDNTHQMVTQLSLSLKLKEAVAGRVSQAMLVEFGELTTPEAQEEAKKAAAFETMTKRVISREAAAAQAALGKGSMATAK